VVTFRTVEQLKSAVGSVLGESGWRLVPQQAVDAFADLTDDHQWIHVDVDRAAGSQFGGTIVHGYFTLALGPVLAAEVYRFEDFEFGLNYGLDRLRFPAVLQVDSRLRLRAQLVDVREVTGGVQLQINHEFHSDRSDKPVCVAEVLMRLYPKPSGDTA
jgi:acyl dehydratase